jgi:hypothetical protein
LAVTGHEIEPVLWCWGWRKKEKKEKWIKYTGGMKEKEEKPSSCSE